MKRGCLVPVFLHPRKTKRDFHLNPTGLPKSQIRSNPNFSFTRQCRCPCPISLLNSLFGSALFRMLQLSVSYFVIVAHQLAGPSRRPADRTQRSFPAKSAKDDTT